MTRSLAALSAAALVLLLAPAGASAETKRFTGAATVRPLTGSTLTGTTTGTLGSGAIVYTTRDAGSGRLNVSFTIFYGAGSLKGTSAVTVTSGANGVTTVQGTARFTGGTALYRRARGRFTVTGQIAQDGLVTLRATNGTLTYPDSNRRS